MKFVIVLALAVACALAAPPVDEKNAQIVSQFTDINPDGSYQAQHETSNGISAQEKGVLAEARDEKNNPLQYLARSGKFSYVDGAGATHVFTWTADINGYQVEGDDVPKVQP